MVNVSEQKAFDIVTDSIHALQNNNLALLDEVKRLNGRVDELSLKLRKLNGKKGKMLNLSEEKLD